MSREAELGGVAYEAWCRAGRKIPEPFALRDRLSQAMWIESAKAVRAAVLEEAAKTCEALIAFDYDDPGSTAAAAIRALSNIQ